MALTIATVRKAVYANIRVTFADVTFDSSYPTDGEPWVPGDFGLSKVDFITVSQAAGYVVAPDYTNKKLKVFCAAAHAHDLLIKGGQAAASTAALAWYATDILGKEAATDKTILGSASATKGGVLTTAATSALSEVADTTSLATLVVRLKVEGY